MLVREEEVDEESCWEGENRSSKEWVGERRSQRWMLGEAGCIPSSQFQQKVGRAIARCAVQRSSCAPRQSAVSCSCFFSDPQESWHSPCLFLSFSDVIQNYPISTLSVFSLTSKHAPMHVIQGIPLSVVASTSNWCIAAFPLPKTLLLLYGNILVF